MKKQARQTGRPKTLSPAQLNARRSQMVVVDVRGWLEYIAGHIPGAQIMSRYRILQEVPKDRPIALTCLSGKRSQPVANWLVEQGYQKVYNLQGGCFNWQQAGYELRMGVRP